MKRLFLFMWFPGLIFANTQNFDFTGSDSMGVLKMNAGLFRSKKLDVFDTVTFSFGLRINFAPVLDPTLGSCNHHYSGIAIQESSSVGDKGGAVGYKGVFDKMWNDAVKFPDTLIKLDSLIDSFYGTYLGNGYIHSHFYKCINSPERNSTEVGYNRIVYFVNAARDVFLKMQIININLGESIEIRYHITPNPTFETPSVIKLREGYKYKSIGSGDFLVKKSLYDLLGRKSNGIKHKLPITR